MQTNDAAVYAELARSLWHKDGEVEIDPGADVNPSADDGKKVQGMYVQSWHYVSNEQVANGLAQRLEAGGLQPEDLDDLVHSIAEKGVATDTECAEADLQARSTVASDANNAGLAGQCLFLIEQLGAAGASNEVDRLIAEQALDQAPDRARVAQGH
ncbi:MAG TPA: hypothetical protein VN259_06980 [Xanthomonadales bacterium]|nr:hypothetical protein [Xanthomonadales bacterium]